MSDKAEILLGRIVTLAKECGSGGKLPTIRELCERFGVAMATMQAVLANAEEMGVLRREHGRGIFINKGVGQKTVGLIAGFDVDPDGYSDCYRTAMECFNASFQREGLHTMWFGNDFDRLECATRCGLVDAAVMLNERTGEMGRRFAQLPIPTSRKGCSGRPGTFGLDYHAMIRLGVGELASRGARRIACISLFNYLRPEADERSGRSGDQSVFESAVKDCGLSVADSRFIENEWMDFQGVCDCRLAGENFARKVFSMSGYIPDGILLVDDIIASGFLPMALMQGYRPGRDFVCVAHENKGSSLLHPYHGSLVRLVVDSEELFGLAIKDVVSAIRSHRKSLPPARRYCPSIDF